MKLGLIVINTDTKVEPSLGKYLLPAGVEVFTTRIELESVTPVALLALEQKLPEVAKLFSRIDLDLLVFACTSGSFVGGTSYDRKLEEIISSASSGRRTMTTAHAVTQALEQVNAKKLLIITPYVQSVNQIERAFFEGLGFEVKIYGMGISDDIEIGKVKPEQIKSFVLEKAYLPDQEFDTVFVSCTNLDALDVLEGLANMLGVPVISSNLANLWVVCSYLEIGKNLPILNVLQ